MKIGGIVGVIVMLIGISIAWGAWYTVGQSERGILLRYGAIVDPDVEPGLHWKTPWVDSYDTVSVATQSKVYGAADDDKMEAYSRDQQPAHFRISVIYHIDPAKVGEVYWRYGGDKGIVERVLDRHVNQQSKNVFGQFNAISVINERARFNKEILDALQTSVKDDPIIIEGVQVENVEFSEDYIAAVKARMVAEVEVAKLQQKEAQQKVNASITIINAKAIGDSERAQAEGYAAAKITRAKGDAEAIRLNGEALANALSLKAKALAENPSLIGLAAAEKWSGVLPTQMIPGGTLPFINVGATALPVDSVEKK